MRRVMLRLMPFLMLCYFFALLDRVNVGFAALQMNKDLGLTPAVFGLGASLFFLAYFMVEVPSNLALQKFGARRWIARIMITWGLISAGMAFVVGPIRFYACGFMLGAAEAGFFPGVVPVPHLLVPRRISRHGSSRPSSVSIPVASFIGSPISGAAAGLMACSGLKGWQWLFILEAVPTVLLGIACLFVLTDRPAKATWLTTEQRAWLDGPHRRPSDAQEGAIGHISLWQLVHATSTSSRWRWSAPSLRHRHRLSVWQPQILKGFGLTNLQTGFLNSVPYGIASVLMILWGRHSDQHRRAPLAHRMPLLLIALRLSTRWPSPSACSCRRVIAAELSHWSAPTRSRARSGPCRSSWMSAEPLPAGLAGINAIANLVGGGRDLAGRASSRRRPGASRSRCCRSWLLTSLGADQHAAGDPAAADDRATAAA